MAQEIAPGTFNPTPTHYFMSLLASKGLLLRCYTQNIDSLESLAGVDPNLVVAAHGNFGGRWPEYVLISACGSARIISLEVLNI